MKNKLFYVIVSIVLAITTTLSVMSWFKCNKSENVYPEYSYAYDCIKEAELNYHKTKALLCDAVQKYISETAPTSNLRGYAIVEECERFNIDIKFVLAQGEIESHYATKGLGAKLNSVFNVGIFDDYTIDEISSNYKYDYPNQSIRPYLKLLTSRYLVNKLEEDLLQQYVDIESNRYASDINYEAKLKERYIYIMMHTEIDRLQKELHNYALKCNRI